MVGYAVCIWLFKASGCEAISPADNFYYMGFIYRMLTSLAVTLIQYADGTNAAVNKKNSTRAWRNYRYAGRDAEKGNVNTCDGSPEFLAMPKNQAGRN